MKNEEGEGVCIATWMADHAAGLQSRLVDGSQGFFTFLKKESGDILLM